MYLPLIDFLALSKFLSWSLYLFNMIFPSVRCVDLAASDCDSARQISSRCIPPFITHLKSWPVAIKCIVILLNPQRLFIYMVL